MDIIEGLRTIPSTRYQGSKRKILPWIYDCIKDVEFNTVLDAFGGSGMVSYLFKCMGKSVTYNDLYRYNCIIGESFVANNKVRLTDDDVEFILQPRVVSQSLISDTFQGIYYLDAENKWLDMVIQNIESLSALYSNKVLRYKKDIAYNALFQSCMAKRPYNLFHRKNLDMRTRDVSRNFGNKTTWDKPFSDHFCAFVQEINHAVFDSHVTCNVSCKDVFTLGSKQYDLVYLDPPYIKKKGESTESSDYLRCYHFLEGIANYSQWERLIDSSSINKRIRNDYAPNHFLPDDANKKFEQLIKKFSKSIVVLSYRYGGTPTIDDLAQLMLKYKSHLKIFDMHYKYALNKQNGDAALNREYLLIGY